MTMKKFIVSKKQFIYTMIFVILAAVFTSDWINDNSGLRPGNGAKSELARLLAKLCVTTATYLFYSSIAIYACHRWNIFRGQGSSTNTPET